MCEVSAFVAEFICVVGCQSCLDSSVIPSPKIFPLELYPTTGQAGLIGLRLVVILMVTRAGALDFESGELLQMFSANVCTNQLLAFKIVLHATRTFCCPSEMNWH